MSKEMYISSSPHETKVAVLEDDQLVEVYFERDTDVGLVGGIYKGRVSRVLPGMQSAFVDIGLERDAFLYVSDFFYEDQEEYDKVFEEAEARATKFTAQQAEAPPAPTAPAAPTVTEAAPPLVAEVVPSPVAPPEATPPPESSAATVAPPSPTAQPPAPRVWHDHRPFDPRRGRRRRHRGRPDFGESRPGDRRFPPPHHAEEPSTESHPFEILPGESLAKYSHAAPAPIEEAEAETPEDTLMEAGQDSLGGADADIEDNISGEGEASEGNVPIVEVGEMSIEESPTTTEMVAEAFEAESAVAPEPVDEAAEVEPAVAAGPSSESPAATGAVLTEAPLPFTPGVIHSMISPPAPISSEFAEMPAPLVPAASAPAPPDVEPVHAAEVATPSPEAVELKKTMEAAATEALAESATAPPESSAVVPASDAAELDDGKEKGETDEEISEEVEGEGESLEEAELLAEASEGELDDEGELPAEVAAGAESEGQPVAQEAVPGDSSTSGAPATPGDRTYTLREPHQRPRFAPRRRRGRRGPGGDRGPRRFDKPRDSSRPAGNHHPVQIAEVLKEGQEILVQIAREPLGTKGARITSHVALPGRYLVFMPTIDHIGVSRKIASEEERLRLRNIILENKGTLTGGFIVRTAGQGRSEEEFKADLKFLSTLWAEIRSKADRLRAPALIHRDLDLVQRLLRDLLTPDFKCVRVDSEIDYERVLDFVNRCQPALVGKVKLYSRDTPLYEEFGIQQEIEKALKPKVWLKSGGYIVINQTEALVAIDVNTGKYVGKTNRLEDTIVKTNVDAVNEIVRQVRLRDLGGIIVIDFIDMDERKNRAKVVQALEEALRSDRAPTKVISFHDFGLVAVTRKRVKQSLERTLCEPCSYCSGSGWVKSVNTVCNEILAEARKMAKGIDGNVLTLRVNPEVAKALKSREGGLVSELESLTKKDVIIKSDPNVHQERFEIY
jgi:ribonuclease G